MRTLSPKATRRRKRTKLRRWQWPPTPRRHAEDDAGGIRTVGVVASAGLVSEHHRLDTTRPCAPAGLQLHRVLDLHSGGLWC